MGTVVLGKLESGTISKAQQLIMMPNRVRLHEALKHWNSDLNSVVFLSENRDVWSLFQHTVEVLSLLSDDVETDDAGPGENLKLRLKGIEEEEILPGFILCNAENLCHSGRTFDAQVERWLQIACCTSSLTKFLPHFLFFNGVFVVLQIVIIEHKSIICPGYNAVLHIHTCIEEVQITVRNWWLSLCCMDEMIFLYLLCANWMLLPKGLNLFGGQEDRREKQDASPLCQTRPSVHCPSPSGRNDLLRNI